MTTPESDTNTNPLYALIPLEDFKAIIGIDDRENKTARFCLITATLTIEEYCKRKFLQKQYFETIQLSGSQLVILKEYPVSEILAVFTMTKEQYFSNKSQILEDVFYRPMPGNGYNEEIPFELLLSPSLKPRELAAIKVIYRAGYSVNKEQRIKNKNPVCKQSMKQQENNTKQKNCSLFSVHCSLPQDLSAACLELASWNFNRYKGKRIGMSGNIRGAGVQGEHFEISIPENVRTLIEPYKRKMI